MDTVVAVSTVAKLRDARPSFVGIVRGEFFKISRQRLTWFLAFVLAGIICLPYLISGSLRETIQQAPLEALYLRMGSAFYLLRVFSGIFLVLLTARLIGMEYSNGTIRVLLARGVGRMQLLGAKLLTLSLVALVLFVLASLLNVVLTLLSLQVVAGNLDGLKSLQGTFWSDTELYGLTVLISMGVTILMAAAAAVVTRSLAGGLSVGLAWFPADNIGLIFFFLAFRLTQSTFWTLATGDLLGPNLNVMAGMLLPDRAGPAKSFSAFNGPFVPVDGGHTLLVTAIYAVAFVVVAFGLTGWRDVNE